VNGRESGEQKAGVRSCRIGKASLNGVNKYRRKHYWHSIGFLPLEFGYSETQLLARAQRHPRRQAQCIIGVSPVFPIPRINFRLAPVARRARDPILPQSRLSILSGVVNIRE
jgi:hypothetical protein